MIYWSMIKGHVGACVPTWLNKNQVWHMLDGGVTGEFRRIRKFWFIVIKFGPKFHGIIRDGMIYSTALVEEDDSDQEENTQVE